MPGADESQDLTRATLEELENLLLNPGTPAKQNGAEVAGTRFKLGTFRGYRFEADGGRELTSEEYQDESRRVTLLSLTWELPEELDPVNLSTILRSLLR